MRQITQSWNQTHRPPRDRHRENPTLREYIVRKPRTPQHLWTLKTALAVNMKVIVISHPSNNYANKSHFNLTSPGKQPTPPTLSITTQDKTSFEPKPKILRWSTQCIPKKNKIPKQKQGNPGSTNPKYTSLLRHISPATPRHNPRRQSWNMMNRKPLYSNRVI